MNTKPCSNCRKPVPQTEGRKEKKFCSPDCRQRKWQQDQKDLRAHVKQFGMGNFTPYVPTNEPSRQEQKAPQQGPYAAYEAEIKATTYAGDLEKIVKAMRTDSELRAAEKDKLKALADEHRTTFY